MRYIGSLLVWVLPEKVIGKITGDDNRMMDVISSIIGTVVTYTIIFQILPPVGEVSENNIFLSALGGMFFAPISLILTVVFTWTWHQALEGSQVEGKPVRADFDALLNAHFQIWAVAITFVFLGIVTSDPVVQGLMVLAVLRTMDLEARVIRQISLISLKEAYKGVCLITVVYGGSAVVGIWLVNKFF